ncbi:MAG: hypothetical protein CMM26_13985 [Rhodospirillaceae bacterium]|nr:hypothetical protein [Rhodospirillaceae bacterium]|tara:strand:- start:241 stop:510 length:270 start_codon:yes stop_codon:yes gene_type:complete
MLVAGQLREFGGRDCVAEVIADRGVDAVPDCPSSSRYSPWTDSAGWVWLGLSGCTATFFKPMYRGGTTRLQAGIISGNVASSRKPIGIV